MACPTRRGAIELLRFGPLRAGELADSLNMSKSALSRHLRVLREAGFVWLDDVSLGAVYGRYLSGEPPVGSDLYRFAVAWR